MHVPDGKLTSSEDTLTEIISDLKILDDDACTDWGRSNEVFLDAGVASLVDVLCPVTHESELTSVHICASNVLTASRGDRDLELCARWVRLLNATLEWINNEVAFRMVCAVCHRITDLGVDAR